MLLLELVSLRAQEYDTVNNAIVNAEIERTLDASSHLLKITELITLEVAGGAASDSFLYFIEPTLQANLAYIEARVTILKLFSFGYCTLDLWKVSYPFFICRLREKIKYLANFSTFGRQKLKDTSE